MSASVAAFRLVTRDAARLAAFYRDAFDFVAERNGLRLGAARLEFVATQAPPPPPVAANDTSFQHFAIVVADMDAAHARLRAIDGWSAISRGGPVRLPASSGGVAAFKFRDPEGHPLELLWFPPGSDGARRHAGPGLFLGVDHSALVVADATRSIAFHEAIGFSVAARGLNRGETQARLDGLATGAATRIEVISLVGDPADPGPRLELLCYREPVAIEARVADDNVLATEIVLRGDGPALVDPDGHRLRRSGDA